MACQSSRFSRLFGWRYLRWALALPALPLALWACNSHPLQQPSPVPQQQTDILVAVNPIRMLDIIFMVDNSPSMDPKQAALADAFPQMIDELKQLPGGLPDVHIAVVSSDLGAGRNSLPGNCSRVQGDQGTFRVKSDCGVNGDARWLESSNGNTNFTGDISKVFGCVATLGTSGCGYEHQLKAVAVSLQRPENQAFLREDAYLAIVLISDEDDCSAPWESDMFLASHKDETTSLRCATRGHVCDGHNLEYPTTQEFKTDLANCAARDTNDMALMKISEIIGAVREKKARPSEQIIVAGIFGWPADGATDGKGNPAQYHIGVDPTAVAGQEGKLDYLPICEVQGLGKNYAGIRLKAFVDAFGKDNGLMFPLCANDFKTPMQKIGEKLRKTLDDTCINYPLIDTSRQDGLQPTCSVVDRVPAGKTYTETKIPPCNGENPADGKACWELAVDTDKCTKTDEHVKINVRRGSSGTEQAPPGTMASMKCLTCARPEGCAPQYKD
jgi:hypothetical protein